MKQRFTEEQIIKAITRLKRGEKAKDLGREFGVSDHTIYNWRAKFNDMTVNEAKRLRPSWPFDCLPLRGTCTARNASLSPGKHH